jgi:hypothetical protein
MKPMLKALGSERLKLEHAKLLSNFAFKFNLRHCNGVTAGKSVTDGKVT